MLSNYCLKFKSVWINLRVTQMRGVILRPYPFFGNFTMRSMEIPITNCLPFFFQTDRNFYQIILSHTLRRCPNKSLIKLEGLKVLRRLPDLLDNVKIDQGQLQLIMEQILFYHIWGLQTFWSSDLNNLINNPSNSPVISEKQMLR